jgi:3-hydroxyacyl-CoA dehydrogenase
MIKNVSVIGAGTMGNGIAHVFAQHGFNTLLVDISEDQLKKAWSTIDKNLERMVTKGTITAEQKAATLQAIRTSTDIKKGIL